MKKRWQVQATVCRPGANPWEPRSFWLKRNALAFYDRLRLEDFNSALPIAIAMGKPARVEREIKRLTA